MGQSTVHADPSVVLGQVAVTLAQGGTLSDALGALAEGLGLRTAVLRRTSGELLGVAGEVLHAVPAMRAVTDAGTTLEIPVVGLHELAALSVVGGRPSQLPALRAAAAVLALALAPLGVEELLDSAEEDRNEIADALHDGPVQTLVVARYAADAAVRGGDPALARDAIQQGLVEVRRTLWSLRPRGGAGLLPALQQLAAQRLEAGSAPLLLEGDLSAAASYRGARAVVAYRFVQACAVEGAVTLSATDGTFVVELSGSVDAPDRWVRRARALGGDLTSSAGQHRLALPLSTSHTDARIPS